jgi:hypothetical protein
MFTCSFAAENAELHDPLETHLFWYIVKVISPRRPVPLFLLSALPSEMHHSTRTTRKQQYSGGTHTPPPTAKEIAGRLDAQLHQKLLGLWKVHDARSKREFCEILEELAEAKAKAKANATSIKSSKTKATTTTTPKDALFWLKKLSPAVTESARTPREACERLWSDRTPRGEKVFTKHALHGFLYEGYGKALVGVLATLAGLNVGHSVRESALKSDLNSLDGEMFTKDVNAAPRTYPRLVEKSPHAISLKPSAKEKGWAIETNPDLSNDDEVYLVPDDCDVKKHHIKHFIRRSDYAKRDNRTRRRTLTGVAGIGTFAALNKLGNIALNLFTKYSGHGSEVLDLVSHRSNTKTLKRKRGDGTAQSTKRRGGRQYGFKHITRMMRHNNTKRH